MGRHCTICTDRALAAIEAGLASGRSAGSLAAEHGLGEDAIRRHARSHRGRALIAVQAAEVDETADPLDRLVSMLEARLPGADPATLREYRLALLSQLTRRNASNVIPTADILATEAWTSRRTRLLEALEPFPEARLAVARAFDPA